MLCHNDCQENNILIHQKSNQNLILIDHEYSGWNPMQFDLANYFNETMFDNAHPGPERVKFYGDNMMTEREVYEFTKRYLEVYFENYAAEEVRK